MGIRLTALVIDAGDPVRLARFWAALGDELCVVEPGNAFLAGCGLVGAVSCDGSRQEGCFWSAALGWPLVWDQDEETAIQAPYGGTKISWGGPPLIPRTGRARWRFALDPSPVGEAEAEIDRLTGLGAIVEGPGDDGGVSMTSPDGNAFSVQGGGARLS